MWTNQERLLEKIEDSCSSKNLSQIGSMLDSTKILEMWSAIVFLEPFLSKISRSNSYSRRIHLISLGFVSFLDSRCPNAT